MPTGMLNPDQGGLWAGFVALVFSIWAWLTARSEDRIRSIAKDAVRDSKEYASAESVSTIYDDMKEIRSSIARIENILLSGYVDPLLRTRHDKKKG